MDETVVSEGPRDVGHDHDLLPQPAAVRPPYPTETARHLIRHLVGRELSSKKARDNVKRRGEGYEAVFDALAPPEARARVSEVERPLLPVKVKERLHQAIGSSAPEVSSTNTPCDFIKSPEHVDSWEGPLPLPGRPLHQSNLRPTKGSQEMAAPRKGESVRGLVSDRSLHPRHGKGGGADCTSVSSKSVGHVDRRRKRRIASESTALAGRPGLPEVRPAVVTKEACPRLPEVVRSCVGVERNERRDPPLE